MMVTAVIMVVVNCDFKSGVVIMALMGVISVVMVMVV